jgi:hypothetical protein
MDNIQKSSKSSCMLMGHAQEIQKFTILCGNFFPHKIPQPLGELQYY